jgi:hypothetical protein
MCGQKVLQCGFLADCIYWLWTPVIARAITTVAVGISLIPFAALYGMNIKTINDALSRLIVPVPPVAAGLNTTVVAWLTARRA